AWFGIKRCRLDVRRKDFAVAVENIRPRRQVLNRGTCTLFVFTAYDAEIDKLATDDTIDAHKTGDGHPKPVACTIAVLLARSDKSHVAGQLFIANRLNTVCSCVLPF